MNNINIFNFFKFKDSVSAISWDSLIIRFGEPFKLYLLNLDLSIKQQVDLDDVEPRGVAYQPMTRLFIFYVKLNLLFTLRVTWSLSKVLIWLKLQLIHFISIVEKSRNLVPEMV